MSVFIRVALVAVTGLAASAVANSAARADKPVLEGVHQIVAGERSGKAIPEDALKGCTCRIIGDKMVAANKEGQEFLSGDFALDAGKTPCAIVIKLTAGSDKGKELHGLVERKDNTIRLIYAAPGTEKPTEFKTKEGQAMYVMKCDAK